MNGLLTLTEAAAFDMELMKSMPYLEQNASALQETAPDLQNDARTCAKASTPQAQRRSRPVRLQLIGPDGKKYGKYADKDDLAKEAERLWPGQEQADDGEPGWSIQLAGFRAPKIRRSQNR